MRIRRWLLPFAALAAFLRLAPAQDTAFMPAEGQGVTYKLDKTTPLPDLIKRLADSKPVDTGEADLVGYTQDMFSIAAHGDAALPLLRDYIKTAPTPRAKVSAISTIYLVGIDSQPRDDSFENPAARQALLDLLADPDCTSACVWFLARDPWRSDVPTLMNAIAQDNPTNWIVINSLVYHYPLGDLPLGNAIPKAILDQPVFVPEARFKNVPDYPLNVIKFLCDVQPTEFKMDPALLGGIEPSVGGWSPDRTAPIRWLLNSFDIPPDRDPTMRAMHNSGMSYKFQYYVEYGIVFFCTPQTARDRIRGWYALHQQQFAIDPGERARTLALLRENARQVRDLNRQIDAIKFPDMSKQFAAIATGTASQVRLSPEFIAKDRQFEPLIAEKRKLLQQRQALNL